MGRVSAWFGGLTTGKKAFVVAGCLVAFAVLSPLVVPLAWLFLVVSALVVGYRLLRGRPFRRPGAYLLGSLVVLVLASGVSEALYGTSTERASSPSGSQTHTEQEKAQQDAGEATLDASPETTAEPTKSSPEKSKDQAAAKPKPEPEPKPKPARNPKPKPAPTAHENHSPYDVKVTVTSVVDGDTVEISPAIRGTEDVRLIGIDTPETVDPSEEVEPYGPEASAFAAEELTGQKVGLEFDEEKMDEYGRLLAYAYADGSMFNEELVEKGYAQAYPYPPNTTYEGKFAAAQARARASGIGIWALTTSQQCELADRGNGIGEGTPGCTTTASASSSAAAGSSASADPSTKAKHPGGGAVAPISEDDCPRTAPIKGNQSGLYHVPGGAYYDVTNPEECFATPADAEAAGYEVSSR